MPDGRGRRAWRWRSCLSAWFAALLAVAPVAQPSLPIEPGAALQPAVVRGDGATANPPAAQFQPTVPTGLGILSRLLPLETAFGPAPAKAPLHRPAAADGSVLASARSQPPQEAARAVFQRSSVGTARTPTGPPV